MPALPRFLMIQNHSADPPAHLTDWFANAGVAVEVVRAQLGEEIPASLSGYQALIVLGGAQNAFDAADGTPGAPWFPELKALIAKVVLGDEPYLGICLGLQLAADALGGRVGRSALGRERGVTPIRLTAAAATDPLFAGLPAVVEACQWHQDYVCELPPQATVLGSTGHTETQICRLGERAWGVQFHPEWSTDVLADHIELNASQPMDGTNNPPHDASQLLAECEQRSPAMRAVWSGVIERFAQLAVAAA